MVDCIVTHNHLEEGHFAAGFTVLAQLRQEDILTDISLVPDEAKCNPVRAHKLVLMANSDYFRTMFKACFAESTSQSLLMPEAVVLYFYSGQITISNDNVIGLLGAASLLLLPRLVEACGQFLSTCLDQSNCLHILAMATSHDFGDSLDALKTDAIRYIQLHFQSIYDNEDFPMDVNQLTKLLLSDDLCVDNEENVFACVTSWIKSNVVTENLIKDSLIHLWETVRFPHLSSAFMTQVVETSPFFETIKQTQSYLNATASSQSSRMWSRSLRRRGHNYEVVVAHADGLAELEYLNTAEDLEDRWKQLALMPENCGIEGVALAGYRSKVFCCGGNSPLIKDDYKQGRTCFYYDLEEASWRQGPSLQQRRWNHGCARVGDTLYAVGGCGQQNSMEAVSLTDLEAGWAPRPSMEVRRHVPGVGVLDGLIYVVGGADSQWNAHRTAECFHPGLNDWVQLPEMHCPRAQPAVLGHGGLVYVMGGRNSKKVELKSVECYDPLTNLWTLWDTDSYSLRKKRWASAAVPFAQDNLLLIGGRGKWTANTVEVFSLPTKQWQLAAHSGVKGHDKRYSACTVTKPHDRWGP